MARRRTFTHPVVGCGARDADEPAVGGDTLWLDTEAAHDALSNGMRTKLANRRPDTRSRRASPPSTRSSGITR